MKKVHLGKLSFLVLILAVLGAIAYFNYSIDMISFGGFIIILGGLILKDSKKVKFQGGAFIRRTKQANNFIDRTAKRQHGFWTFLSRVGIVVGILGVIASSLFIIKSAWDILQGAVIGGAGIVLPGPVSSPVVVPGVFVVPWWIWVIGIFCVIVPHEFLHGIMFRLHRIKIKSVGWLVFLFLPGAFVEPDEAQLKRARRSVKLKAYAAGSFANLAVAFVIALILISATSFAPQDEPAGIVFQVINNTPAMDANLTGAIIAVDGKGVKNEADLREILRQNNPGDVIRIDTLQFSGRPSVSFTGRFDAIIPQANAFAEFDHTITKDVILAEHPDDPEQAYLGIAFILPVFEGNTASLIMINVLVWIYIFSFGIGLINLLPIKPLDGGLIFEELVSFSRRQSFIVKVVSIAMLLVLLFNIFGVFIV